MTPRTERFVAALLLSFCLWCFRQFTICREAKAQVIAMGTVEDDFYATVAEVEGMREGYEDYQVEVNAWGDISTGGLQKRGNS